MLHIKTLVESEEFSRMLSMKHSSTPPESWYDGHELLSLYEQFDALDVRGGGLLTEENMLAYGDNGAASMLTSTYEYREQGALLATSASI
jgi:hypothetical protein